MARRTVDCLCVAGGRAVALAVIGSAQMRSALEHLARDRDVRRGGIKAFALRRAARIGRNAATAPAFAFEPGLAVPVGRPFPDIAGYII